MILPPQRRIILRRSISRILAVVLATGVYSGLPIAQPKVFSSPAQAVTGQKNCSVVTPGGFMWMYGNAFNAALTNCKIDLRFDSGGAFNVLGTGKIIAPATGTISWRAYIDDNCDNVSYFGIYANGVLNKSILSGSCVWTTTVPVAISMVAGQQYDVEIYENASTGGGLHTFQYAIAGGSWTNVTTSMIAPISPAVKFNANGGTGTASSELIIGDTDGDLLTLASVGTLAYTGFTFKGWNTSANGFGTFYPEGGAYVANGATTLYAQWERTLTYNANNGTGTTASTLVRPGMSAPLAYNSFTPPTGMVFMGWSTTAGTYNATTGTNNTVAYLGGSLYSGAATPTVLYAVWGKPAATSCVKSESVSGGYKYVTYTSGTDCLFVVPSNVTSIDYLAVGGGGGGGRGASGAGGGGGGVLETTVAVTPLTNIRLTVADIAAGAPSSTSIGTVGKDTSLTIGSTIHMAKGGAAGNGLTAGTNGTILNAAGTTSIGGVLIANTAGTSGAAGRGTAGIVGYAGADGRTSLLTGLIYGSGGGGGGYRNTGGTGGSGAGAGGDSLTAGSAGLVNRGGGGGGGGYTNVSPAVQQTGGAGGSGIVVIRYLYFDGVQVSSVTSSPSSGKLGVGDTATIIINFTDSITVNGTPTLTLETGTTDRVVNCSAGSDGKSLVCTYTVQAGDGSADLASASTASLDFAGAVTATSGASISSTLPTEGAPGSLSQTSSLVIDTGLPIPTLVSGRSLSSGTAKVSSTESGTAYLVFETITAASAADILSLDSSLWNSVSIVNGNSISNISLAGLIPGNYKLYVVDETGNFSAATNNTYLVLKPSTAVLSALESMTRGPEGELETIVATLNTPGVVQFKLGGVVLTGCSAVNSVGLRAYCPWTVAAYRAGAYVFTATLTPTDTTYETSTALAFNFQSHQIGTTGWTPATINSTTLSGGQLTINFTAGTNATVVPFSGYQYSLDGGDTWVDRPGITSPIIVTGLSDTGTYSITIRGYTLATGVYPNAFWFPGNSALVITRQNISYVANGADSGTAPSNVSFKLGTPVVVDSETANSLTRTGFTFAGWALNETGTGTTYQAGDTFTTTVDVRLYAKWTSSRTYDANGGETGTVPSTQAMIGTLTTYPVSTNPGGLQKTSSAFGGWSSSDTGTGTNYPVSITSSVASTGNTTLYARWFPISVGAGNRNISISLSFTATTTDTFTVNIYDTTTVTASCVISFASPSCRIQNLTNGKTYTIKVGTWSGATWYPSPALTATPLGTLVNFDPQGGSVSPTSATYDSGTALVTPIPTRAGYSFLGWTETTTSTTYVQSFNTPIATGLAPYQRFVASDFNTTTKIWADSSGNGRNSLAGSGSISLGTATANSNGTIKSFPVVSGGTSTSIPFGNATLSAYTVFEVSRYSGATRRRILTGDATTAAANWLMGHYNTNQGYAYYGNANGWAFNGVGTGAITNWEVSTGYQMSYRSNGVVKASSTTASVLPPVGINFYSAETSDYEVAEVIIFDRTLTAVEIANVEKYLIATYGLTDAPSQSTLGYVPSSPRTLYAQWGNISLSTEVETATVNQSYSSFTVTNTLSGTSTYSISPALPSWATLNTLTGRISGTPLQTYAPVTYRVTANNGFATSQDTFVLNVIAGLPGAPVVTASTLTAGNASVTITWAAPTTNGGDTITAYTITASPGGATCIWTSGPLTCTIAGLTNGSAYTFSITATNSAGTGPIANIAGSKSPVGYLVTYNANGGTSPKASETFTVGTPLILPTPTRSGYYFLSWDTASATSTSVGVAGANYTPATSITLYAKWIVTCSISPTVSDGVYTLYSFTTVGSCGWQIPIGVTRMDQLVVGGGGAGGWNVGIGGGGGGVYRETQTVVTPGTILQITVGAGGSATTTSATAGSLSSIQFGVGASSIANGGMAGTSWGTSSACNVAKTKLGGTATGAISSGASSGGAGGFGSSAQYAVACNGAAGIESDIGGTTLIYGAGGGGGSYDNATFGYGGNLVEGITGATNNSGAGNGGKYQANVISSLGGTGAANRGGGGGGGSAGGRAGGSGGSGVVLIRILPNPFYRISFDTNTAISGAPSLDHINVVIGGGAVSLPTVGTMVKTGNTFAGWSTSNSGTIPVADSYTANANITLYAIWAPLVYTVTYDTNTAQSGAPQRTTDIWTYGVSGAITLPTVGSMLKQGFRFLGWSESATGGSLITTSYTPISNKTLYAQWAANSYRITYKSNFTGGASDIYETFTAGTAFTLKLNSFTRSGFDFYRWSDVADGSGRLWTNQQIATLFDTTTVFAIWKIQAPGVPTVNTSVAGNGSVTVTPYFGAGTCQSAVTGTGTYTVDTATYSGYCYYTFTSGVDTFTVPNGNSTINVLVVGGGGGGGSNNAGGGGGGGVYQNTTLNASSGTVITVQVGAAGLGGVDGSANSSGRAGGASQLDFNGSTYIANGGAGGTRGDNGTGGLSGSSGLVGTTLSSSSTVGKGGNGGNPSSGGGAGTVGTTSSISGTAIYYGSGGGGGGISGGSGTQGAGSGGGTNPCVSTGVAGTSATANRGGGGGGGSNCYGNGGNGGSGIVIIKTTVPTSGGNPESYTVIAYNPSGQGSGSCNVIAPATNCTINGLTNNVIYNFKATAYNATGTSTMLVATTPATPKPYIINYAANGGVTTQLSDTYTTGTPLVLPTPTRNGYSFTGWFDTSTAGNLIGAAGANYSPTESRTVYAQWVGNTYTISFNGNGNNGGTVPSNGSYTTGGSAYSLPANSGLLSKPGYTFSGWDTATVATGPGFSVSTGITVVVNTTLYAKWTKTALTLSYTLNGGSTSISANVASSTKYIGDSITLPVATGITRAAFNFGGWSDGNAIYRAGSSFIMPSDSITITAIWIPVSSSVTYSANTASGLVPTQNNLSAGETFTVGSSSGLAKNNYSFVGWSDGSSIVQPGATYTMGSANVILTAQWSISAFDVTYATNSATGSPSRTSDSFVIGSPAINLPTMGTMVKTGYSFAGWSESSTGTVISGSYTPLADKTLYAIWTPNTYSIAFDSNGGTGSNASQNYTTGNTPLNLSSLTSPSKNGYTFGGWATSADGSGVVNSSYTPTASISLYAVWNIASYLVAYDINGGDSSTAPTSQSYQYSSLITLGSAASRSGYDFVGWVHGGVTYAAGASFRMGYQALTFTAKWVPIYTVTYVLNGGSGGSADQTYVDLSQITVAAAPTKTGYTFDGWKDQSNTIVQGGDIYTVTAGHYILTAQWSAVQYSVTYQISIPGATAPTETPKTYGDLLNVKSAPTINGYVFNGWNVATIGAFAPGSTYIVGAVNPRARTAPSTSITFTASYTPVAYSVTYDLAGGSGTVPTEQNHYVDETFTAASSPVRTGYTFNGWSDGNNVVYALSIFTMPASNVTLTALWSAETHTVTYDLNGGTSTLPTQAPVGFDLSFTIASTPIWAGHTFLGWYDGVSNVAASSTYVMSTADITFVAQWQGLDYSVTYELNGGSGTRPTQVNVLAGETFTVASGSAISKSGFTFAGWSDGSSLISSGSIYTVTSSNVTLAAQWTQLTPLAPQTPTAIAADSSGTVTVSAASNGGIPTSYTVTAVDASGHAISPLSTCTIFSPATSCTVSPLINGQTYYFSATATNAVGTSDSSTVSSPITPAAVPNIPTNIAATVSDQSASISFTTPSDNGSAITGYTVVVCDSSGNPISPLTSFTGTASPINVTGLTNGTQYTFRVFATNGIGNSLPSSPTAAVTPTAPAGAPTGIDAVPGDGQAVLSWTAPASNGGSAISGYQVTVSPGGQVVTVTSAPVTITGLTNGVNYNFSVVAINGAGNSLAATDTATPFTVAGAPTAVTALAGITSATVSFTSPLSNGGESIDSYTVIASPGGATAVVVAPSTTASFTGLTAGTAYTFTVIANNAAGQSLTSASSLAVVPFSAPDSPTAVSATAIPGGAVVAFTPPSNNGGSVINGYTVTAYDALGNALSVPISETGTVSPITILGLFNGTTYTFKVTANNSGGSSSPSTISNSVVPIDVPTAPQNPTVVPGVGSATISFNAPANNGGSSITSYTITSNPGGFTASGNSSPLTVTGLSDGIDYVFTVSATNAAGTGSQSVATNSIQTIHVAGSPTSVSVTANTTTGQAHVSWVAPLDDGGTPLISYTVVAEPVGATISVNAPATSGSFTGLINGTPYTFVVIANNSVGASDSSTASSSYTPYQASAPLNIFTATPTGITANTETLTAQSNFSGNPTPVLTYTWLRCDVNGANCTSISGETSSVYVLTPSDIGFKIRTVTTATNNYAGGTSVSETSSATVVVTSPLISNISSSGFTAVVGNSFTLPSQFAGGSAPFNFTISSGVLPSGLSLNATTGVISGFTSAVESQTVVITAIDGFGVTTTSEITLYSQNPTPPTAPRNITASATDGSASVSWQAPSFNGGSPVTGYLITLSSGETISVSASTFTVTFNSLTNGRAVTFAVEAINNYGNSTPALSSSVTPVDSTQASTPAPSNGGGSGNSGSGGTGSVTPTPSASPTATPKPSASPTATPKPSASPTATPKPSVAPTATPKPSATKKPSASPSPTKKATASPTATPKKSSAAPSPSVKPTTTKKPSPSPTKKPAEIQIKPKSSTAPKNKVDVQVDKLKPGQKIRVTVKKAKK